MHLLSVTVFLGYF